MFKIESGKLTREHVKKFVSFCFANYGDCDKSYEEVVDLWFCSFEDYDANVLSKKIEYIIKNCKEFPTVSDIRKVVNIRIER